MRTTWFDVHGCFEAHSFNAFMIACKNKALQQVVFKRSGASQGVYVEKWPQRMKALHLGKFVGMTQNSLCI